MESAESTQDEKVRKRALRVLAGSGASAEQFGEPRGDALEWDGTGLPDDAEVADAGALPKPQDAH